LPKLPVPNPHFEKTGRAVVADNVYQFSNAKLKLLEEKIYDY